MFVLFLFLLLLFFGGLSLLCSLFVSIVVVFCVRFGLFFFLFFLEGCVFFVVVLGLLVLPHTEQISTEANVFDHWTSTSDPTSSDECGLRIPDIHTSNFTLQYQYRPLSLLPLLCPCSRLQHVFVTTTVYRTLTSYTDTS